MKYRKKAVLDELIERLANIEHTRWANEKLKQLEADGLCAEDCGCVIDNLCPCSSDCMDCVPGQRVKCPECETVIFVPLGKNVKDRL